MMTSLSKASVVQVVLPIIITCFVVDESTLKTQFFIQQKEKRKKKKVCGICITFIKPCDHQFEFPKNNILGEGCYYIPTRTMLPN